jgi:hypothetical protein
MKAGIVETEKMLTVRQQLGKKVPVEMNIHATTEELLFLYNGEVNTPL